MFKNIINICKFIIICYTIIRALQGWWYFGCDTVSTIKERRTKKQSHTEGP